MPASVLIRRDTHRLARRRKPRGSFPRRFPAFLFENLCTAPLVCRRPRALPASRTFGARPQPLNTLTIDAFNGKTVTRETLLRYTFKSRLVNVLIRGFLWKTSTNKAFGLADAPASYTFSVAPNAIRFEGRKHGKPVTVLLLFP